MRGKCDAVPEGQGARAGQLILIILALVIPWLVGVRLWFWQRQTNIWRRVTSPARRPKRLRSGDRRHACQFDMLDP